jgi:hypothetical protein
VLDIEGPALICKKCGYALASAGSQVTTHLSGKHQTAPELRNGLTKLIRPLELPDPVELPLSPDDSQPHPHLKVRNGHVCRRCDYRTTSLDLMTRHARQHIRRTQATRSAVDDLFYDVLLQTWVHGASRQYWTVHRPEPGRTPSADPSTNSHVHAMHKGERERIMTQVDERMDIGLQTLENTRPWMERTQWEKTYGRYRRDLLSSISVMGSKGYTTAFCMGEHKGTKLISSAEDEQKISRLVVVVDHMLNRCEETMHYTGRPILCWLRTGHGSSCLLQPFQFLGRPSSRKQYRLYFKRFVTFIFRAYRMGPALRKTLHGVTFKRTQLDMLRAIWDHQI